ncbi:S41 family peptidase [Lacipirellula limnantheis]|uniref:Carboxy-terminal processing protease CtpB n=1 Tax=Lacipirellula limnantheis TaxID=2528024 RepID=A0A517TU91_9BACT|nr:S41 family peptidase [Lacipirellula limnantheis]QDT71928.1 Carboxy-terminal processing protease CtpB precursor [Lacipirellula limnantheis]
MSYRNLMLLMAMLLVSYACYVRAEQNPYARYVAAGFSVIDDWALEKAPDQELFNGAMHGMISVLHRHGDQHSEFVDANQQDAFTEEYDQEFGGVGIRLRLLGEPQMPTVIGLPEPGTPAAEADIRLGDRIEAVDGKATAGLSLEEVTRMVRGPIGEPVTLTIMRPDAEAPHAVTIDRAVIMVESILGDVRGPDGRWNFLISENPRIGYVRIRMFGDKTAEELSSVLAELTKDDELAGLIIDVRDDAGGALDAAVEISDLFLRAGRQIVSTRDRDGNVRDRYLSTGSGGYAGLPLVVLVDRNSASASEIVAACLQDYDRAKIVGERSYGKGTVQRLMHIESGRSMLKLTSATYWRPSEKNIHRMPGDDESAEWGVTPDDGFLVPLTDEEYEVWRNYRGRRDLIGEGLEGDLAKELTAHDGELPADYQDQALRLAIEFLSQKPENSSK